MHKRKNCLTEELAKSDDQKVADVLEFVTKIRLSICYISSSISQTVNLSLNNNKKHLQAESKQATPFKHWPHS
jgi:hypothetical protein